MTELATRDPSRDPTNSLTAWAESARQVALIAQSLAKTPFIPASLRDRDPAVTIGNITAAVLTGREIGMLPMASLRSVDVIQGVPALRAITLRALVLAAGHEIWVAESTNTRAIVRGRRKGSDQVQESVWSMDRAKALGLSGKDNYRKQPGAMLVARATAECARLIAADAILGLAYSAEELDDGVDSILASPADNDPPAGATTAAPGKRTAQRRTTKQPAAVHRPPVAEQDAAADLEPDFDEPGSSSTVAAGPQSEAESGAVSGFDPRPASDPILITEAQARKLHAGFRELGVTDRGDRLEFVTEFLGREVTTSAEVTREEATRLIDDVERRISMRGDDTGDDGDDQ